MEARSEKEALGAFKCLLVNIGVLSEREAEIYINVLTMGQATAADIHRRLEHKQEFQSIAIQSIHKSIEILYKKGFLRPTIASGKRQHARLYKANPPEGPLENYLNDADKLRDTTNEVVALLEKKYEEHHSSDNDQNVWVYEPHKTAFREGIRHLKSAKKTIAVYSNNYSWLVQHQTVKDTLKNQIRVGLEIRLLGLTPVDSIKRTLAEFNNVRRETTIPCTPYCLIDGEQLLVAFNEGLDTKLLATKNTYLLDKHSTQFNKIWDEAKRV